eukprot:2710804-Rhodomonas_salina.2
MLDRSKAVASSVLIPSVNWLQVRYAPMCSILAVRNARMRSILPQPVLKSAYHDTRQVSTGWARRREVSVPISLRACYAVPGTDIPYGATRGAECMAQGQCSYAMSGTHIQY